MRVYPLDHIPTRKKDEDTLYNLSIGVICGGCLCFLVCLLLVLIIKITIDNDLNGSSST